MPKGYVKTPILPSQARSQSKIKNRKSKIGPSLLGILLLFSGCTQTDQGVWTGPNTATQTHVTPWDPSKPDTHCIATPHYRICTDITDTDTLDHLGQLMEGAYSQYTLVCPAVEVSPKPMQCYIFARRAQWADFTTQHTGKDAAIYLQISRGAYTINDWFVAFWLGDRGTFSVASHEGFHQFVARHFAGRLAPALEEGFACMFENVEWEGPLPRWNLLRSNKRSHDLNEAIAAGRMWPLSKLLKLHAGDVISLPREEIDTFYAQDWALAAFLWDGDDQHWRPALQQYLADIAAGRAWRPPGFTDLKPHDWNPNLAVLQLEHYLGCRLNDLEPAYLRFCRETADAQ